MLIDFIRKSKMDYLSRDPPTRSTTTIHELNLCFPLLSVATKSS